MTDNLDELKQKWQELSARVDVLEDINHKLTQRLACGKVTNLQQQLAGRIQRWGVYRISFALACTGTCVHAQPPGVVCFALCCVRTDCSCQFIHVHTLHQVAVACRDACGRSHQEGCLYQDPTAAHVHCRISLFVGFLCYRYNCFSV